MNPKSESQENMVSSPQWKANQHHKMKAYQNCRRKACQNSTPQMKAYQHCKRKAYQHSASQDERVSTPLEEDRHQTATKYQQREAYQHYKKKACQQYKREACQNHKRKAYRINIHHLKRKAYTCINTTRREHIRD